MSGDGLQTGPAPEQSIVGFCQTTQAPNDRPEDRRHDQRGATLRINLPRQPAAMSRTSLWRCAWCWLWRALSVGCGQAGRRRQPAEVPVIAATPMLEYPAAAICRTSLQDSD